MFKKKVAKTDFNKSLLPHNRKEQFSFIFKNRKRELFYIGLLLFIFIIPIIVGFGFYNVLINILYNDYKSASVGLTGDDLIKAYETYRTSYVMYTDIFSLAMIGGLIVFGIGVSGVIYLIRNLYWGELFFFKESFFKGIKQNALMVCLIFAIYGVINWLCIHIFILDINEWLKNNQEEIRKRREYDIKMYKEYGSSHYHELYNEDKQLISWHSDETAYDVSNILNIWNIMMHLKNYLNHFYITNLRFFT